MNSENAQTDVAERMRAEIDTSCQEIADADDLNISRRVSVIFQVMR